jgi:hypothetical protein
MLLWELLERRRTGMRRKRASAQASLDALTAARAPHAACAHAFVQLYERNRSEARRHHQAACELAQGKEPKLYERYLARR